MHEIYLSADITLVMQNKLAHPLLIFGQSVYLIQVVVTNSNTEWQIVQIQICWLLQKPTDLDLHCLQSQGISGFSRTKLASVDQLDAPSDWRPGGRGFNPRRGRQHSFVEIDHEIFSTVILSLPLIQDGQLSVSGERMCTILVNRLED